MQFQEQDAVNGTAEQQEEIRVFLDMVGTDNLPNEIYVLVCCSYIMKWMYKRQLPLFYAPGSVYKLDGS